MRRTGRAAATPGRAAAAAAGLALLLSSCAISVHADVRLSSTSPASTTTAPPNARPLTKGLLSWHGCHSAFRCATLVVPASYTDPAEGTFTIAVVEAPASVDPAKADDIVMNPGGPGEGGVSFLTSAVSEFSALRTHFNLVSFDPRGTGSSEPVQCEDASGLEHYLALDPSPTTPAQIATVVSGVKAFIQACVKNTPARVLANLTTLDTARDMDRLRAALGQERLNYFGFSYGTYLGSLYAAMFPSHVGAFVLDGAIDPSLSANQELLQQAEGFETDLHDFFAWCDQTASCSSSFSGATEAAYEKVMDRLKSGGTLTADMEASYGGSQQIGYGVALTGTASALYSRQSWKYLGEAIAEGLDGQGSLFLALADSYAGIGANGQVENIVAANIAISCADRVWPSSLSQIEADASVFAAKAPDFGGSEAWGNLACGYWPVKGRAHFGPIRLAKPLPILIVGSTHDPATPYAWAEALSAQLKGSRLLTRTGDGHTGYLASACVRRWVNRYFATMELPPSGTVCAS